MDVPARLDALQRVLEAGRGRLDETGQCALYWTRAEIEDGRLHDVRRTIATGLAKLGVVEDIIERTLNHTRPGDRLLRTYNTYQYIPEKREALERWSRELTQTLGYAPTDVLRGERRVEMHYIGG